MRSHSHARSNDITAWVFTTGEVMSSNAARLRERFARLSSKSEDARAHAAKGSRARAAVVVALRAREDGDGTYDAALERRARHLRAHANEVALPGGKFDAALDECDRDCALREAREEVGLDANALDVVGELPCVLSRFMISVRPIIGEIVDRSWVPTVNEDEVAEVFYAPLEMFLSDDERHRFDDYAWPNATRAIRVHYFDYQGKVIWGLTAAILIRVASVVYGREPAFQESTDEGVSVWDVVGVDGVATARPRSSL